MLATAHGPLRALTTALAMSLCLAQLCAADTVLTEREAVLRALRENPGLAAARESVAAHEAAEFQAHRRPNPELSFEIEELRFSDSPDLDTLSTDPGGSALGRSTERIDNSAFAGAELTLSISQKIELGRKRAKRIALADRATQVALWDYEAQRADVIASTRHAFTQVLAGQNRAALRRQLAQVAEAASLTVRQRVQGGKVSPLQGDRADIEYAQARIALTAAERELAAWRASLAAQWGSTNSDFDSVRGDLNSVPSLPSLNKLEEAFRRNPDLARWTAEIARRDRAVDVERAQGIPDLTVSAGWRNTGLADVSATRFDAGGAALSSDRSKYDDSRENSLVVGFSIPLPLHDRNRGRIREAEHRVLQASHERSAFRAMLAEGVIRVHERLKGLSEELRILGDEVVPTATRTYEGTKDGFEQGKFEYLSVLDAQRTLFEVRNQNLEALVAYHVGVVELERLLGSGLEDFPGASALEESE